MSEPNYIGLHHILAFKKKWAVFQARSKWTNTSFSKNKKNRILKKYALLHLNNLESEKRKGSLHTKALKTNKGSFTFEIITTLGLSSLALMYFLKINIHKQKVHLNTLEKNYEFKIK